MKSCASSDQQVHIEGGIVSACDHASRHGSDSCFDSCSCSDFVFCGACDVLSFDLAGGCLDRCDP